jgi:hypothetical protein
MKNLAKPLEWEESAYDNTELAYVHDFSAMYSVSVDVDTRIANFQIEGNIVWQSTGFKTLDDAKDFCQKHYATLIWDNLSPRAKVAVSIGMATLAQLNMTDKTLAEVIKEQNF